MNLPKLTKLELRMMETFWKKGPCSIREVQESFSERERPAYTTVQTIVSRLEFKKAIRRTERKGNAHIFEAVIERAAVQGRMIDEVLKLFGGRPVPLVAHLVESGRLKPEEVREAQKVLREYAKKEKKP